VKKGDGGSEDTALVLVTLSKDDMCALFQTIWLMMKFGGLLCYFHANSFFRAPEKGILFMADRF
jgi:hypothetical protein